MRAPSWSGLVPLLAFVTLFAAFPVAALFAGGLSTGGGAEGFLSAIRNPLGVKAVENSLEQGALSAGFATLLGFPAGICLSRWEIPGRKLLLALLPVPFLLPSLVVILGVDELVGPAGLFSGTFPWLGILARGIPGIVAVNVLFNAPMVALLTATAVAGAPAEQEESVLLLGGSPLRAFRESWGRPAAIGAAAGALLTFLFSALAFAAPLIVCGARCYTVEARVFLLAQVLAEHAAAAQLALWGVLLFGVAALAYVALLSRLRAGPTHRARAPPPVRRAGVRAIPFLGALAVLLLAELLLVGTILARGIFSFRSAPGSGFLSLFQPGLTGRIGISTLGALGNTILFAVLASGLVLFLCIGAIASLRNRNRSATAMEALLFVPLLVSPILLAFSLATVWRPVLGREDAVWILIVLSQAMVALPLAFPPVRLATSGLARAPSEAATSMGAAPGSVLLEVELPRLARPLGSAALLALAVGLGEFTATYFLYIPRFTTLPVELYLLEGLRQAGSAGAIAALLLLASLAAFLGIELGGRRLAL